MYSWSIIYDSINWDLIALNLEVVSQSQNMKSHLSKEKKKKKKKIFKTLNA